MRYGFIGLGHLGRFLAGSLVRAGFDLTVNDLDKANAEGLIASGAKWAADPQALAERVDCVITCLPSPKVSEAVLTGPRGILAGLLDLEQFLDRRDDLRRLDRLGNVGVGAEL